MDVGVILLSLLGMMGMVELVVSSPLTRPIRKWVKMATCRQCLGFWIGLGFGWGAHLPWPLLWAGAISFLGYVWTSIDNWLETQRLVAIRRAYDGAQKHN